MAPASNQPAGSDADLTARHPKERPPGNPFDPSTSVLALALVIVAIVALSLLAFVFEYFQQPPERPPYPVQFHNVMPTDPSQKEMLELDREVRMAKTPTQQDYWPFYPGNKLFSPKEPPGLRIDRDYPRLDGAAALIPLYAAAANTIYGRGETEDPGNWYATAANAIFGRGKKKEPAYGDDPRQNAVGFSTTTPAAYKTLIDDRADMIFAGPPSSEQTEQAAEQGISFTVTPIAREAFVFLVNEQNPVTGLTTDQVRDIYSGKINDWKEVGGTPGDIIAFQRNFGSGSQNAMLSMVMRGTMMREPHRSIYREDMMGYIRDVAAYRNLGRAIGYSFRYYATVMNSLPGIRLLSIDGVAPTVENIRNGSYPLKREICIITARPLSDNARRLRDWFLSAEGQQFIADVGYVPLATDSH